jgi:acyl carrier protein
MITTELKKVILKTLKLEDWDLQDQTLASEVPGWDSLNHVNVILAVEKEFNVKFKNIEVLKLQSVGDLQRLLKQKLDAKS